MSGVTAMTVLAGAAAAGTAYSIYAGEKARGAQEDAQNQARANAQKTADAADQATNRANQKAPDASALLSANQAAAKGGPSGTMLTGTSGIDPSLLQLGKSTLLGQ